MSIALEPALYNSMNESVALVPALMRNSLILTRLTLRTFSIADSVCIAPLAVQAALPTKSPLNGTGPDATRKVPLTVAPGTIGSANDLEAPALHPAGTEMLSCRPVTGAPVVFRNVTMVSCED